MQFAICFTKVFLNFFGKSSKNKLAGLKLNHLMEGETVMWKSLWVTKVKLRNKPDYIKTISPSI